MRRSKIRVLVVVLLFLGGAMLFGNEQSNRKSQSEKILRQNEIPILKSLPLLPMEKETILRSKDEIFDRVICLTFVAAHAEGFDKSKLAQKVKEFGVVGKFTPDEEAFLCQDKFDQSTKARFIWRYESIWTLLWALGYVGKLGLPVGVCDVEFAVKTIAVQGREKFIANSKIRSTKEILNEADLIYRIHWATTEARLMNAPMPAGLNNDTVYERHYSLNWLIRYQDQEWDKISTDT